jgi:translocation and assembly module TamB
MIEVPAPAPRRRLFWKYLRIAALLSLLFVLGMGWWVTTESFQTMVRTRLVTELENITGGRVELGSIHTTPFRLRVEVRGLTVHGKESRDDVPLAHVDRVVASVKIISILGAEFGFHSVLLDRPILHLIIYPDGTTNQPSPRLKEVSGKSAIEQLFRLSITRLEVRHGEVRWNNQSWPMDFEANDISADMTYSLLRRRYESNLLLGKIVTQWHDFRPLAWMLEAHFELAANNLVVTSLKATSGRSTLQAHGRLADFRRPEIEAAYNATIDLNECAAIAHRSEMHHGMLQAQGSGTWSMDHFAATGKLFAKDFDWHDAVLNLPNVTLESQYSVTPQQITATHIEARLLGGFASGDAQIANWLEPATGGHKRKLSQEAKGAVRLRLKDMSAAAVTAALATSAFPLQKANLAATANGTLELRWTGSTKNTEVEVAANLTAPSTPPPGAMPVNGNIHATYRFAGDELEIAELNASSRASEVHASGKLSSRGTLKVAGNTSNLAEWQRILAAAGDPLRIPAELHGRASFTGTATGPVSDVSLQGNLQAEDFDYRMPATARTPEQNIHWDLLTADSQVSRHGFAAHNATLRRGDATIHFDVSGALDRGHFTDHSAITARVAIENATATEIMSLAGYNYPIQGTLNLRMQAAGSMADLHGGGHAELTNATIHGEPVRSLVSDVQFQKTQADFSNIQIEYGPASIAGAAGYDFSTRAFHFYLKGDGFDIARLPGVRRARLAITGKGAFVANGSGSLQTPVIDAAVEVADLTLDGEPYGAVSLKGTSRGTDLHLSGHTQSPQADLSLDGNIQLQGALPAVIDVKFNRLDIDALVRTYSRGHVTGHSAVAGTLHLQGPLLEPARLALAVNLSDLHFDVENVKLHNEGPVRAAVAGQVLIVEPFRLVGENTDFGATGSIQLNADRKIDVNARGQVNLRLIQSFNPDFTSSGTLTVNLTVSGTFLQPVAQGRLEVSHGALAYVDLTSALSDINGTLLFNQNRFQVESLTAHTGGGLVTFGGSATWFNRQLSFDVSLQERGVRLRYPPGVSSTADADLHFVGSTAASILSGDITVTRLAITPGFDFGAYLIRSSRGAALPQTNPLLNRIRLDVHVVTTPDLPMQTAVVRLSGDADLRVRGTAAKPVILGRADILEGQVFFNGTKYELERGEVSFTNPVTTTPVLDLQATTHVRDYDITLTLSGEPSKMKVSYRSEPPLAEADIITLVALGRTTQESAQLQQPGQSSFTQDASSAILNQALNTTVTNRAQHLFGVSRIKIDPQGLSTETNLGRGPLVTIEQQVANNVTVTYSTSVEQASQQIIQVEYNISRNVSIVAIRDQNGVVSFDVRVRRRKK